jgi:hypothetical protein
MEKDTGNTGYLGEIDTTEPWPEKNEGQRSLINRRKVRKSSGLTEIPALEKKRKKKEDDAFVRRILSRYMVCQKSSTR